MISEELRAEPTNPTGGPEGAKEDNFLRKWILAVLRRRQAEDNEHKRQDVQEN